MGAPLFPDSEGTITSAEINIISLYKSRVDFQGDEAKKIKNGRDFQYFFTKISDIGPFGWVG